MKIEIEMAQNGYILKYPSENDPDYTRTHVIQVQEDDLTPHEDLNEQKSLVELFDTIQELFGPYNSKHRKTGIVTGVCSEHRRWDFNNEMKESLKDPLTCDEWDEVMGDLVED